MVKVAICIPAYKNRDSLLRLLESIFKQTFKDYVVIITDDTNTNEIQHEIQNLKKDNIIYKKNASRLGATANCNKAMEFAQAYKPEYIKLMHHDDFFTYADSLEKLVGMLDGTPKADIAFSGTRQVSEQRIYERCISEQEELLLKEDFFYLYKANVIGAPSAVLVRNKKIDMDVRFTWLVDVEWYMDILEAGGDFVCTKEPLVSIGMGAGQLTNECISNAKMQMKEYCCLYTKYKKLHRRTFRLYLYKILIQNVKQYMKSLVKGKR